MSLTLVDWRRRVADLSAAVRATADPESGWRTWRDGRDELFAGHPDSPLDETARASFTGLPFADYDPALRFEPALQPRPAPPPPAGPAARGRRRRPPGPDRDRRDRRPRPARRLVARRLRRWDLPAGGRRQRRAHDGRRGPLPARHGQGRRPGRRRRQAGGRPQLRLPPVVHLRPALVLSPGAGGKPHFGAGHRRGAVAPRRLVLTPAVGAQPRGGAPAGVKSRPSET